ncbi:hypothetical protein [Aphanizomenon flos-aquae]|uniref:hypothetical protein n=1 Tax=Aphanizomenon flos-aquae TaxID=1176 RepID=UPI000AC95B7A|nr:hypothetical protein [Aphanizomenon flos-aquae]
MLRGTVFIAKTVGAQGLRPPFIIFDESENCRKSHFPTSLSHPIIPTSQKSELLAAALVPSGTLRDRYRLPTSKKAITRKRFAIAPHHPHNHKRSQIKFLSDFDTPRSKDTGILKISQS